MSIGSWATLFRWGVPWLSLAGITWSWKADWQNGVEVWKKTKVALWWQLRGSLAALLWLCYAIGQSLETRQNAPFSCEKSNFLWKGLDLEMHQSAPFAWKNWQPVPKLLPSGDRTPSPDPTSSRPWAAQSTPLRAPTPKYMRRFWGFPVTGLHHRYHRS